jgi:hypothetical protein
MIEKEFVPYEQALALKQLGFNEPCFGYYIGGRLFITSDTVYNSTEIRVCIAPIFSQVFRWFRDNHDIHVQIRKENYFHESKYEYFHFDISKGEEDDITKQSVLLDSILDECTQDIPGNHLNDEKYSKLIFEKRFAFKTYEEIEIECLNKLIEIIKTV